VRIVLLSVGKPADPVAVALHDRYAQRLRRLGVHYRSGFVADDRPGGRLDEQVAKRRQTERLLERAAAGRCSSVDRSGSIRQASPTSSVGRSRR
jgi:hypothetical protein